MYASIFRHPPPVVLRLVRRLPRRVRHMLVLLFVRKVTLGVSAIILDEQGRILLARHTYRRPAWDYPSGLVDADEQPAAAVEREVEEELGVRATAVRLLHAENHRGMRHITLYYRVSLHGPPRHTGAEVDDCRYVPFECVASLTGMPPATWLRQAHRELAPGGDGDP